jgi:putative oxidoreductase
VNADPGHPGPTSGAVTGGPGRSKSLNFQSHARAVKIIGRIVGPTLGRADSIGGEMNTIENRLTQYQPYMLSIFRIVVGLLFLQHGLQKWFGIPSVNPAYANIQLFSMYGLAGVIEIVCGSLVTVGLFTRYAAFIASGEMAVSYWFWSNRMARGFAPLVNGGMLEVMYCFAFLYLFFAGAGLWSLDAIFRKRA